ncbi:hypothetical protein [Hymenobacter antarcticus]|uniref:Uncharacterized protein n=1 Tax=Hymenobacter antarcticus TaxID=486270 RepID=A0ABP7QWU0_9BACT
MAGLTDITFYDNLDIWQRVEVPGSRAFRLLANYVSDLYVQCLHGYKPPKISRISLCLVAENTPPHCWKTGSIALINYGFSSQAYNALTVDADKALYLLESLQDAVRHLCHAYGWDLAVFEGACHEVKSCDIQFRFMYPEKVARDGKKRAHLLLEKTLTTTFLSVCIDFEGKRVKAQLYEGPNRWWYDPIYAVTKHGRWINNDQFGVKTTRHDFQGWFSLQANKVCVE